MASVMYCFIINTQEGTSRKFIQCESESTTLVDLMAMHDISSTDVNISASQAESGPWIECQLDHPMSGLNAFQCKFIKVTPLRVHPAVVQQPATDETTWFDVLMKVKRKYSYLPEKKQ